MALNFPLSLPASPGFSRLELIHQAKTGRSESFFNFYEQVQEWAERWEASCTLPPISDRATLGQWEAWALAQRGGAGTFLMGDPKHPALMGAGPAAGEFPTISGTQAASGKLLTTRGWGSNRIGVVKQGDVLQIAKNFLTNPRDFTHADWEKQGLGGATAPTVTANAADNPDPGTVNDADQVDYPVVGVGQFSRIIQSRTISSISGHRLIGSIWVQPVSGTPTIWTSVASGSEQEDDPHVLSAGWQRIESQRVFGAAGATANFAMYSTDQAAVSVYVWGGILYSPELDARLHKVIGGADSDSGGLLVNDIWPRLRAATPDFSPLILTDAKGTWRLRPGAWQRSLSEALIAGLGFEAFEAINLA